jgi:hypothetical protein
MGTDSVGFSSPLIMDDAINNRINAATGVQVSPYSTYRSITNTNLWDAVRYAVDLGEVSSSRCTHTRSGIRTPEPGSRTTWSSTATARPATATWSGPVRLVPGWRPSPGQERLGTCRVSRPVRGRTELPVALAMATPRCPAARRSGPARRPCPAGFQPAHQVRLPPRLEGRSSDRCMRAPGASPSVDV